MQEISLLVNGQEITFSKEELSIIVEKYLSIEAIREKEAQQENKVPIQGKWFKVNPLSIDQNLFSLKRDDEQQEGTRLLIRAAFEELKKRPEKYGKIFETMMPVKTWTEMTVKELKELAPTLGEHIADWVEQALEWAQRISNGEQWATICNIGDTANWYRLVKWSNEVSHVVGGSKNDLYHYPATRINYNMFFDDYDLTLTVPLVVRYK